MELQQRLFGQTCAAGVMLCLSSLTAQATQDDFNTFSTQNPDLVTMSDSAYRERITQNGAKEKVFADAVDEDGARCKRGMTLERVLDPNSHLLSEDQAKDLLAFKQVTLFDPQKNGYEIGYVLRIAPFDPELVMAVYSSAGEHKGVAGLGDFIVESKILGDDPWYPGNPFRVSYEQQVDFPYSNGEYTMENKIGRTAAGAYVMASKLIDSSDSSFSPRWADGYLYAAPYLASNGQTGTFVVACNYMVPHTTSWAEKFRDLARERLTVSGSNLMRWVERVTSDKKRMAFYRSRLKKMVP